MTQLIDKKAVLEAVKALPAELDAETVQRCIEVLSNQPAVDVITQWIPFTTRPLTEEEKEEHSECDSILDCKLPDDGQQILVSVNISGHERVQCDEFYMYDGCYLGSGYEIGTEAVAWMPLPTPYERKEE